MGQRRFNLKGTKSDKCFLFVAYDVACQLGIMRRVGCNELSVTQARELLISIILATRSLRGEIFIVFDRRLFPNGRDAEIYRSKNKTVSIVFIRKPDKLKGRVMDLAQRKREEKKTVKVITKDESFIRELALADISCIENSDAFMSVHLK